MLNIQSDSRKIKPGDTFIAVKCEVNDGHAYVEKAIENGASKVVVEKGEYSVPTEVVDDTRVYLNNYLEKHYNKYLDEMTIIGITGTNGKTTSAFLTYQMLNKLGVKTAYIGTIGFYMDKKIMSLPNTSVDICDTYDLFMRAYDNGYKCIVLEVSSHALANGRLKTVKFDIAAFTNLTQDHLDFHKTMENYALAKQQLFKMLRNDKVAIVNSDDSYKDYYLLEGNNNITFGENGDFKFSNYKSDINGLSFKLNYKTQEYQVNSKLMGKYNVYNLLTMIAIVSSLNYKIEDIIKLIPELSAPLGRIDTIDYKNNKIIIDYAHTPDAIEKVLTAVECSGKKYTVFGCTGDRDRTKRPIMGKLVSELSEYFIITDDDPHNEDEMRIVNDILEGNTFTNYEVCIDRKEAIKRGINLLKDNDILFILGKGHEEFIIKGNEKIPHNDREEVLKCIENVK